MEHYWESNQEMQLENSHESNITMLPIILTASNHHMENFELRLLHSTVNMMALHIYGGQQTQQIYGKEFSIKNVFNKI